MKTLQQKHIPYIFIALAAVILALSVSLAVVTVKNKSLHSKGADNVSAYESLSQENESIRAAQESEAASYQNELQSQNDAFSSERDALNQTIADLNRQLSVKRATTTKNVPAPAPVPQPPQSGSADLSAKTIYLTFDDGPSARTPEVLQILADNGVKATFFVINGGKHNRYMKDIVDAGHTIALHSYTHNYKTIYSSDAAFLEDLQKISDLVYEQTGVRSKIMRFPGGASNTVSRKYNAGIMTRLTKQVTDLGYRYYDWNLSSGDATGNRPTPVEVLVNNCRKVPHSNAVVVLMHDAGDKRTTVEALPQIIAYYKEAGCKFAAIDANTPTVHQKVAN